MRLIDADALITWLSDCLFGKSPNPRMTEAERHDAEVMYEALEKAIRGIKKMPSIDAVQVVRCKDCKHYKIGTDGLYYCYNHDDDILWQDDDYCSRGERKEK